MTLELLKSKTGRTLIESHRGVEGCKVPENSWPAIEMGYQLSADLIEVDVQLSQDGVAFVRHNYTLPDGRWCNQVCWEELEDLKIDGETLPKLEDVLVWARDSGAHLSLDMKTFFKPGGSLAKEVVRLLERTNTVDQVLLLFFDHEELLQTKLSHSELAVRALVTGRIVHFAEYLQNIKADCVSVSYGILRPEDIEHFHSTGMAVVLVEYWNPDGNIFQNFDIDVLSCANPVEARNILKHQSPHF
jgi:glycerophosphoryl diester phosphodiesterase